MAVTINLRVALAGALGLAAGLMMGYEYHCRLLAQFSEHAKEAAMNESLDRSFERMYTNAMAARQARSQEPRPEGQEPGQKGPHGVVSATHYTQTFASADELFDWLRTQEWAEPHLGPAVEETKDQEPHQEGSGVHVVFDSVEEAMDYLHHALSSEEAMDYLHHALSSYESEEDASGGQSL